MNDPQNRIHVSRGGETVLPAPLSTLMGGRDFTFTWERDGDAITVTFTHAPPAQPTPEADEATAVGEQPDRQVETVVTTTAAVIGADPVAGSRDAALVEATARFVDAWRTLSPVEQRAVADTIHGVNQPVPHPSLGITGTPQMGVYSVRVHGLRMKFARDAGSHPVWLTLTRE